MNSGEIRDYMVKLATLFSLFMLTACGTETTHSQTQLARSEQLIDAFYAFSSDALTPLLPSNREAALAIAYYQGWAEGGEYKVLTREPCAHIQPNIITCHITVEDNLIKALQLQMHVTDTFKLFFNGDELISVETSSNDPDEFYAAQQWIGEHHPELIAQPCDGFFAGGQTPGDCVRAMVEGFSKYHAAVLSQPPESP